MNILSIPFDYICSYHYLCTPNSHMTFHIACSRSCCSKSSMVSITR